MGKPTWSLSVNEDRTHPVTMAIATRWARLSQRIGNSGLDVALAATALEHGLTIATRNVSHFVPTGVPIFNPFEPVSPAGG